MELNKKIKYQYYGIGTSKNNHPKLKLRVERGTVFFMRGIIGNLKYGNIDISIN